VTTDRQRDAEMDRLLRTALRPEANTAQSRCPEAGLLAAYIEQALAAEEKERLHHHLAGCSRCQQTLAVMTRDLPAQDTRPQVRTPWLSRSHWRWLVPAALAASLTVYLATRQAIAPGVTLIQPIMTQSVPEAEPPPPPLPPERPAPSAVRQSPSGTLAQLQPAEFGPERRAKTTPSLAKSAEADQTSTPRELKRADAKAPANAAPAAAPLAEKPAGLRRNTAFVIGAPMVIGAPGGNVLWRLETGGRISRSQDDGATWYPKRSGVDTALLAGSAPSAAVCWIVGIGGTVLLTTDGERWDLRPFPARVDLTGVEARSARVATVTARDGRRFSTGDGGATWTAVR